MFIQMIELDSLPYPSLPELFCTETMTFYIPIAQSDGHLCVSNEWYVIRSFSLFFCYHLFFWIRAVTGRCKS